MTTVHTGTTPELLSPDPAQILVMARHAADAATELETHDPGKNRDAWRGFTAEMHGSATQLTQATQAHSQLAMLSAARRLDASCVRCHEVFNE